MNLVSIDRTLIGHSVTYFTEGAKQISRIPTSSTSKHQIIIFNFLGGN